MDNIRKMFNFDGKLVEIIMVNEEPLFNARNIGECLDITESAVRNHILMMSNKQVVKMTNELVSSNVPLKDIRTFHNTGENFFTEMGLYKLILKSRKPSAEKFQDWVCNDVLPSIRKHGMYVTKDVIEKSIADPDWMIGLLTTLKEERAAKEKAIKEKAWISTKREATCMAKTAKVVKENKTLKKELGMSKEWASILRVSIVTNIPEKSFSWRKLKEASIGIGKYPKQIQDPRFGYANIYHADAWYEAYTIDISKLF